MTRTGSRLLILLYLPLLIQTNLFAVEPFRVSGQTNADRLRVRAEPTLEAATLGHLAEGAILEILDVTPEEMPIGDMSARWYRIANPPVEPELDGWSYGAFIDIEPADLLALAIWRDRPELVRELLASGVDPNAVLTEEGEAFTQYEEYVYRTAPIVEAARAGNTAIVEMLLGAGANPDLAYVHGEPGGTARGSALMVAVERGWTGVVGALATAGANLEAVAIMFGGGGDRYEVTALSLAIAESDLGMVELLLDRGADPNHALTYESISRTEDILKSPLDIATEGGLDAIAALIRSYGGRPAR